MWETLTPRPIFLSDSKGEAELNGPPEILGNTVRPIPFDENANIGGWLKEEDFEEDLDEDSNEDSEEDPYEDS